MKRLITLFFCSFSLLFLASASFSKADKTSRIAIIVNNKLISKSDLDLRTKLALASSGLPMTPENIKRIRPQLERAMINETLQNQAADIEGVYVTDANLYSTMKHLESISGMPQGALDQLLRSHNIPHRIMERQVRAQIAWMEVIRKRYNHTLQISDWEVEQALTKHKNEQSKPQYHLAEIVIAADTPAQESAAIATLKKLTQQIQKGAHWGALALQFSTSATAAQGGDMGWLAKDMLEDSVKNTLQSMHPGEISPPISTAQGYAIIAFIEQKLPGQAGETFLTLAQGQIPFPFFASDEEKRETIQKARAIRRSTQSCASFQKKVGALSDTPVLISPKTPQSSFPHELQEIAASLPLHGITAPKIVNEGVILTMLCDREVEKAKEFTRDDAYNMLASKRLELLSRRELRDLRRKAFIDIRL